MATILDFCATESGTSKAKWDLMELYRYSVGRTEVPGMYHKLACLGMIAAAAGDRIGYRWSSSRTLYPNLYIMLVGPSGSGKDHAIDYATKWLRRAEGQGALHIYSGRISAPAVIDQLQHACKTQGGQSANMLLVTKEMKNSVGERVRASDMVGMLTDLYTTSGGCETVYQYSTMAHGQRSVRNPCFNWMAGTTIEWLQKAIDVEDVRGGFGARVIFGVPDIDYRTMRLYVRPQEPADVQAAQDAIRERVERIATIPRGSYFRVTPEANELQEQWYYNRPRADSPDTFPLWKREQDMMLKLAMCKSLADRFDCVINGEHVIWAQRQVAAAMKALQKVVLTLPHHGDANGVQRVKELVKDFGVIQHSLLLRKVSHKLTAERLHAVVQTLMESGQIVPIDKAGQTLPINIKKAHAYRWARGRLSDVEVLDDADLEVGG